MQYPPYPPEIKGVPLFYAPDASTWRQWLIDNGQTVASLWLVYAKKGSGLPRLTYDEAVDEAICFGWIDSTVRGLDENYSIQFFTPRKPKSNWSRVNKNRVERLLAAHKIEAPGLKMIELAKQTGTWTALDAVENIEIPLDLDDALAYNPLAQQNFMAFARTYKRGILEWLFNAKKEETRSARIQKIVSMAAKGLRANFDVEE
jgi:uncharacterized protein YdeI (YjbR/CyaY-like superfamily)